MYKHQSGISLRKIERDDLTRLFELKNESWWTTHKNFICNPEDQVKWFESLKDDPLVMIAEYFTLSPTGVAIYSNIDWISRSLSISGSIFESQRKNTHVVEHAFAAGLDFAFEVLNMQRVEAEVLETNIPAQRLEIDYLGFKVEGVRRKAVYKSGEYYDSLTLGILRDEWANCERVKAYGGSCNRVIDHTKAKKLAARFSRGNHMTSCNQSPLPE